MERRDKNFRETIRGRAPQEPEAYPDWYIDLDLHGAERMREREELFTEEDQARYGRSLVEELYLDWYCGWKCVEIIEAMREVHLDLDPELDQVFRYTTESLHD